MWMYQLSYPNKVSLQHSESSYRLYDQLNSKQNTDVDIYDPLKN
jgi:hypothetical protein